MKTKILLILLLASFIFLSAYERNQVSRYAHRYTRLTEGKCEAVNIFPDSMFYNVNPFIISLEGGSGYHPIADCAHFVSQCLQAGGIQMYENNYSDNPDYLGCVGCKGLNIQAKNNFADSLRMTFHDNFWLEEIIEPVIETDHPYTSGFYSFDIFLNHDTYKTKLHFDSLYTRPGTDIVKITDWYHSLYSPVLSYAGNQGCFWTPEFDSRHPYDNSLLNVWIVLQHNYIWNLYGFAIDSLSWQAAIEPEDNYQQGDFQIFCNYRTDNVSFVNDHEIFYENTYNNIGRTIRFRHAVVCKSGYGNTARVSSHNSDRNDSLWTYAYSPATAVYNSLARNSISFYHINDGTGEKPNLCAYNNWNDKAIITTSHPDSINDKDYFEINDPIYIKYAFQNNGGVMIPDRFQVRVEFENTRTLIDSVLYDGIFSGSNIIDTLFNPLIMPDVDSLIINIKLDAGDSLDYGADWERTWGEQTWHEDFESDNIISKTIYLDTGLQPPTNIEIDLNPGSGLINLQWDGSNRTTYKVYSSTNPYDGFEEDLSGTYNGNSWSASLPNENRFYYVVETDGRGTTRSKQVHYRKAK
ncbi:MAG: amidase domain-containing protein [Candidatus Tenebribacter burtonii]|nr:amidase domain-containing protein [Candidatus Tenebribacter burtonii]